MLLYANSNGDPELRQISSLEAAGGLLHSRTALFNTTQWGVLQRGKLSNIIKTDVAIEQFANSKGGRKTSKPSQAKPDNGFIHGRRAIR
jgi:hypothetical protein